MDRAYWRNLLFKLPYATARAWHMHGMRGIGLALAVYVFRRMDKPFQAGPVLRLTNWREAANYMDNFVLGELRHSEVEKWLCGQEGAVVEVGVNVGVTCRWWLQLNPALHIIGVDMMHEALDYTGQRLADVNLKSRWHPVTGAVGDTKGNLEVVFDDPLEGTNSLDNSQGCQRREVEVNTLDAYLDRVPRLKVLLVKLDIEGHAAAALKGADRLLSEVPWAVVETHHDGETAGASAFLSKHGFVLRHFHGRTMWWSRALR